MTTPPQSPSTPGDLVCPAEEPTDGRSGGLAEEAAEPPEPIRVSVRRWLRARPGRPVVVAGMALVAVQVALRGWAKLGGWFVGDDLSFIGRALTMPVWSAGNLLADWNGHFMPGAFLQVEIFTALWPLDHTPVALFDLTMQAIVSLLVLRLLVALVGPRPGVLVPFTLFVLTPITLPAFVWWAAALNQLWGQLSMVLALLSHVTYHRTGRARYAVGTGAAILLGLAFSEKVLLTLPLIPALTLLWFTPGPPHHRIARAVREHRPLWAGLGTLGVGYLILYVVMAPPPEQESAADLVALTAATVGQAVSRGIAPAVFGGPLTWRDLGLSAVADPGRPAMVAFGTAAVLLVLVSVVRHGRAWFAWLVIGAYVLANTTLLGLTRATQVGAAIGAEYRYHTDSAVVIVVFGTLAFLPLTGTWKRGTPQHLVPRQARLGPGVPRRLGSAMVVLCSTGAAVLAVVSTVRYGQLWHGQVDRMSFYHNARQDIAEAPVRLTLLDGRRNTTHNATLHELFAGFTPTPHFLAPGGSTGSLFMTDEVGRLRAVQVIGERNLPGTDRGCGYRVTRGDVAIPLRHTTQDWTWVVRISYVASADADTTVTAGSVSSPVRVRAGMHNLYVMSEGPVSSVTVGALSTGTLCTDDVRVGGPVPEPDTNPQMVHDGDPD